MITIIGEEHAALIVWACVTLQFTCKVMIPKALLCPSIDAMIQTTVIHV